jgi:hypothetical protein
MARKPFQGACLAVLLALWAVPAVQAEALRLTVDAESLTATGVTAQGRVVFFGISREVDPDDVVNVVPRIEVRTDEDGDGSVAFPLGQPVPLRSAWVAVDLASGSFEAAAPEGFRLKKVNFRGRGIGERPDGRGSVADARGLAEILVVRPGVGAWTLRLGDGGPTDEDGTADGRLEAALDRMEPLPGSPPPPQSFQKDDVVIVLDPKTVTGITGRARPAATFPGATRAPRRPASIRPAGPMDRRASASGRWRAPGCWARLRSPGSPKTGSSSTAPTASIQTMVF